MRNIRLAVRTLARAPGFTLVCLAILALGIGGNTAIFSVIDTVLLQRLPYEDADRLVFLSGTSHQRSMTKAPISLGGFEYYRDHVHSLQAMAAGALENFNLTGFDRPEVLPAGRITWNYLPVLGVQPVLGRNFLSEEDRPGGAHVALISHGLWVRRFGSDPTIAGKPINLDNIGYTILGVMPPEFALPAPALDVWVTDLSGFAGVTQQQIRQGAGYIIPVARLRPGIEIGAVEAEMRVAVRQYTRENPRMVDADPNGQIDLDPLRDLLVANIRPTLLILLCAVGFVLLIACANVASLLLARAAGRSREIAIRAALGASRVQIMRQLLIESLLLSVASGGLGLFLSTWAAPLAVKLTQGGLAVTDIHWDARVLVFTLGVSLLTGVLFGIAPSLQASSPDLNAELRAGGRGTGSLRRNRARSVLVAGQVALSVVLLIGAGLLLRSFVALQHVNPGFDAQNVLTMQLTLPASKYLDDSRREIFFEDVIREVESLPGVKHVGASLSLPLAGTVKAPFRPEGVAIVPFAQRPLAWWQSVTPGYFEAAGIRVIQGRAFNDHDKLGARLVTIVNQSMARQLWPNEDPVGKHIYVARAELNTEVVGVIKDVKTGPMETPAGAEMCMPYAQRTWPGMNLVVRTDGDPSRLENAVRARIAKVDPDEPAANVQTLEAVVEGTFGQRNVTLWLVGAFAALALLLAVVGLYGVMAYSVVQRTKELGIRRALGASDAQISGLVMGQGLALAWVGIALGIAAALALTRVMAGLLFDVKPADPAVLAGVAALFTVVALLASYVPASRARRLDPVVALRDG